VTDPRVKAATKLGALYSFANVVNEELEIAAYHLARAEEHVQGQHWRSAWSELLGTVTPLEHVGDLRHEATKTQINDANALIRHINKLATLVREEKAKEQFAEWRRTR
jgi:hypothetical protein